MDEREAHIALNLLPGIGPIRIRQLLSRLGSPEAILRASPDSLAGVPGIGRELAAQITGWQDRVDLGAELRKIRQRDIRVLIPGDELYPRLLREIHDAPPVLYVWGELDARDHHAIAIVGSRRATHYGIRTARRLGFQLCQAGLTVTSGLARGIDTAAHEGALASGGRTVAVIGSGLGKLFPAENQGLAERIADGHGAVVSEFPIDFPPSKRSFPRRNRVVSGWSSGVIVVEAPGRSGALITADQAAEQGRNVYAVPGPVDRPASQGCNRLIQDGARLIMDGADVLDDLDPVPRDFPAPATGSASALPASLTPQTKSSGTLPPTSLTAEERAIIDALAPGEETLLDEITTRTAMPVATILATLLRLEMKRLVRQLPGQRYLRAGDPGDPGEPA